MRRMLSNKNVVDVVNNAIEQGEIEVGGGLPEIESGDAGKALVVNEQEDGVEWAEVGAPSAKILVVNGNNVGLNSSFEITEEQYTKLQNLTYDFLVIKNTGITSATNSSTLIFSYQQCMDQSKTNYYNTMQYMTDTSLMCDTNGKPSSAYQYLAVLEHTISTSTYKINLLSCGQIFAIQTTTLIAYNGGLSDTWRYTVLGDDPMLALSKGWLVKFKYIDGPNKSASNPYYEAIPVFYDYRTGTSGLSTPAGRITFYSAPGVIFKDFHISFTRGAQNHITNWTLTEITQ